MLVLNLMLEVMKGLGVFQLTYLFRQEDNLKKYLKYAK